MAVILDSRIQRRVQAFANVHTDRHSGVPLASSLQAGYHLLDPLIWKAHPVNDRSLFRQAENPWARMASLGHHSYCPHFQMPESQGG
jgi:hypothetical protein